MELLTVQDVCKRFGIALTGGIATGKSTVARILEAHGESVIDADQLARQVTAPGSEGLAAIRQVFGEHFVTEEGQLNRKAMRDKVFTDISARTKLEAITHPLIQKSLGEALQKAFERTGPHRFFYEAALIFETGRAPLFHSVWATLCPENVQIERLMKRDQIDADSARAILKSQWPATDKALKADLVIDTNLPHASLVKRVREHLDTLSVLNAEENHG